ncbi:MAG: MAPEG family protein [Gammaproteobacteria bacterium]|nr:MAPEG family protein [Gammaproteobacteria bacterium]
MPDLQFPIAAMYIGINLIVSTLLGILVTKTRATYKIDILDGGNKDVTKAMRAHGNNAEYAPLAMLGLLALEMLGGHLYLIHGLGIVFTVSRLLHAQGMYMTTGASAGRLIGTSLTWLVSIVLGVACIYYTVM